jgi:hypothetical protein
MAYSAIDLQFDGVAGDEAATGGNYGEWTDHRIPDDRSSWHPLSQQFYDYWRSIAPAGALPGRQHVAPEEMTAWLSRLWLLDVYRNPLRYRFRVCGSATVGSVGGEVTGCWLDEVHPRSATDPRSRDRLRMVVELGRPAWRRGAPRWQRLPEFRAVESLIVPLAADGCIVDKIMGLSITFDANGRMN